MARPLLLLVLCLAIGAAPVLAGCGGDGGDDRGDDAAAVVEGTGYTLELPEGWDDRSGDAADFSSAGFEPDVVLSADPEDGFATNINVLRQPSLAEGVDVDRLVEDSRRALQDPAVLEQLGGGLEPTDISQVRELELDGEPARAFDYSSEREGRELRFRQIYTVRDGTGHVITYTALADGFEENAGALGEVVDSWSWE